MERVLANASAEYQSMFSTGQVLVAEVPQVLPVKLDGLVLAARAYPSAYVVSVRAMKKTREKVSLCWVSSVSRPSSVAGEPTLKVAVGK